jgi:hypothetical protein
MRKQLLTFGAFAGFVATLAMPLAVSAAPSTVVVTPTNQQGWSTADTRPGGAVNFVGDSTAPAGNGALELTTNATNEAKAQYLHAANAPNKIAAHQLPILRISWLLTSTVMVRPTRHSYTNHTGTVLLRQAHGNNGM